MTEEQELQGKKILIVEDNEMNRDMLSRRLTRKGYEIVMAEDGAAGLDMMSSEQPDLVLMDMGLPVMDGWTATANAKADENLKQIPSFLSLMFLTTDGTGDGVVASETSQIHTTHSSTREEDRTCRGVKAERVCVS